MFDRLGITAIALFTAAGEITLFAVKAAREIVSPSFEFREIIRQLYELGVRSAPLIADLLFEKGANGEERLSDGGRARLDSAMSQFVRYPRKSPLVVETYGDEPTGDERYLKGRRRSQLVRDYLVSKFALDLSYVAVMLLGADAHDSPTGNRWDGIALALFVPATALENTSGPTP